MAIASERTKCQVGGNSKADRRNQKRIKSELLFVNDMEDETHRKHSLQMDNTMKRGFEGVIVRSAALLAGSSLMIATTVYILRFLF